MNETTEIEVVVINLPPEALKWLERAAQWDEDLEAYDRLNTPTSLNELCGFWLN